MPPPLPLALSITHSTSTMHNPSLNHSQFARFLNPNSLPANLVLRGLQWLVNGVPFNLMSQFALGPKSKPSNFDNFTIHQDEDGENSAKAMAKTNEDTKQGLLQQDVAANKGTLKRAPLGEFPLISHNNIPLDLGNGRLVHQIPTKKRAERFEICEDPSEKKSQELASDGTKDVPKPNVGSESDAGKISPGKENIAPKAAADEQIGTKESGSTTYGPSFDDSETDDEEEDGLSSPSEYLTAKSTATFKSAKEPAASEKNPMYISYDEDIYAWMLQQETMHKPRLSYISKQSEINEEMRRILLDWFVDVTEEFELCRATFFLSISLTDRALSVIDCPRDRLQLLGVTCIFIAAKIHEIFPPLIKDIVYVTDFSYSEDQVRRMEKVVLKVVNFELNVPLVDSFADFFNHFASTSSPLPTPFQHLMWYFLELSTLEYGCIRFRPSRLAAAAFILAKFYQRKLEGDDLNEKIWSEPMIQRAGFGYSEMAEPAKILIKLHQNTVDAKSQAIRKKFGSPKRCKVAAIKMPDYEELASQFSDSKA